MKRILIFALLPFVLCVSQPVTAQKTSISFENQISTWIGMNYTDQVYWQAGARYIPTLSPALNLGTKSKIDAELALNAYGNLLFTEAKYDSANYDFKPYRLWLRYSASNLEIRAGLQRITFGSASILRPLMWFDNIDYRDPLQLTEGVYSLLGRYYFNNNANIWLWTLYGNKNKKGWEVVPSVYKIPEFGGRLQMPVPKGELGLSYHHRIADYSELYAGNPLITETDFSEQLIGLDGKWDIGPGLWFEGVLKLNDKDNQLLNRWETYFTLGIDYTFALGNGLNVMSEFFHYSNQMEEEQQRITQNFSALSLNYSLFLSHSISFLVYYNWDTEDWYRLLNLQLKYDYISLNVMAFWNPDKLTIFAGDGDSNTFAGKGFQLMLVIDI
jgi:hypothetical protein